MDTNLRIGKEIRFRLAAIQHDMRMGMVTVIHTFGGDLKWHIHVHLLVAEGSFPWTGSVGYAPTIWAG